MGSSVHLASSEAEYWAEVQRLKGSSDFFDEQGDAHGHIDGDLQEALENVLVPLVGPWEGSDIWFHNQDFYGDGIRALSFRAGSFPWSAVTSLQKLLFGESARFCISVVLYETLEVGGRWIGAMAILQEQVIVTAYALEMLRMHDGVET